MQRQFIKKIEISKKILNNSRNIKVDIYNDGIETSTGVETIYINFDKIARIEVLPAAYINTCAYIVFVPNEDSDKTINKKYASKHKDNSLSFSSGSWDIDTVNKFIERSFQEIAEFFQEYNIANKEEYKPIPKEYRMKCKVCNTIFCYTQEDLEQNKGNQLSKNILTLSVLLNAATGKEYSMHEADKAASRVESKIKNFDRCPNCGSKEIEDISLVEEKTNNTKEITQNNIEQLKMLKEMFDTNLISQEEYERKKKDILGL